MSPAAQAETTTNGVNGHIASGKKNFTGAKPGTKKNAAKPGTTARSIAQPNLRPPPTTAASPSITKAPIALRNYFCDQLQTFGLGSSRRQWESFIGALNAAGPMICGFPAGQLAA